MRGHTQRHGILATGDRIRDPWVALEHEAQRARPEPLGEYAGVIGHLACPPPQLGGVMDVHDQGPARGSALQGEDVRYGCRVLGIGPETVAGAARAGANVLVSGSALFAYEGGPADGVADLRSRRTAAAAPRRRTRSARAPTRYAASTHPQAAIARPLGACAGAEVSAALAGLLEAAAPAGGRETARRGSGAPRP